MEHRNVTVSLPADLVRQARHLAVDRGLSLSRFVAALIEEQLEGAGRYGVAKERQRRLLEAGLSLGTDGAVSWDRDELHQR